MDTPKTCLRLEDDGDIGATSMDPPTGGWSQQLGWFRFYFDGHWVWSPQVEQMHGYPPGTVAPGTELVLSHIHPDDLPHVAGILYAVRRTRCPFSSRHRIVDTRSCTHDVVVSGAPFCDEYGRLQGIQGSYVDMTPATDGVAVGSQREYDRMAARLRAVSRHGPAADHRQRVRAATRC